MSRPPSQKTVRESIADMCDRDARQRRLNGQQPDSREIEKKWEEIARQHDRKAQDGD